jgi:hypothetical protein
VNREKSREFFDRPSERPLSIKKSPNSEGLCDFPVGPESGINSAKPGNLHRPNANPTAQLSVTQVTAALWLNSGRM